MLVTPPRLLVAASQIAKVQRVEIENRGNVQLNINTQLEGVSQRADGSTLVEANAPYSAVNWVRVAPDRFEVRTGTRRYVDIRFRVPSNAEPGDHNVAIIFMEPPVAPKKNNSHAGQRSNVRIANGIGVPALITVPGPVIDDVSVTHLKAPGFSAGGPIPLAATVRESGDVHHSFAGGNRLEARAGRAIVMFPPFAVLRGSTVTLAAKWTHPPLICICHLATAVATDGHRSIATATVVIFPVVQAIVAIIVLAALVIAFLLLRRRQRRKLAVAYEAGRQDGSLGDDAPPA